MGCHLQNPLFLPSVLSEHFLILVPMNLDSVQEVSVVAQSSHAVTILHTLKKTLTTISRCRSFPAIHYIPDNIFLLTFLKRPSFKTVVITLYYQLWNWMMSLANTWVIHSNIWMTSVANSSSFFLQVTCLNSWFQQASRWSFQHYNFSPPWILSLNIILLYTLHKQLITDLIITNICIPFMISVLCLPFSDHCWLEFKITSCTTQTPTILLPHKGFKSYYIFTATQLFGVVLSLAILNTTVN